MCFPGSYIVTRPWFSNFYRRGRGERVGLHVAIGMCLGYGFRCAHYPKSARRPETTACRIAQVLLKKLSFFFFFSSLLIKFPNNCKVARYMAPAALIFLKRVENLIERERLGSKETKK